MKTPETPRSYLPKLADPPAPTPEERESRIVPRYVEIPALREHGFGPRNLFWGMVTLFLALVLLIVALFFAGPKATLSLATALLTFTALFVLSRLHVFRQRNGGFLALALVCLLGAIIPLLESAFSALKNGAIAFPKMAASANGSAPADGQVPLLTQSFALSPPEGSGKRVRVLKDSQVVIESRPFLIKAGDLFSLLEMKGGEATFAVRDLRVSLPANVVDVVDPTAVAQGVAGRQADAPAASPEPAAATPSGPVAPSVEELAAITMSAQREAIRRYPALGIKDSLENSDFVSTYQRLKDAGGKEFFSNPEWPLALAEYLATRSGWARGGPPSTTGPAPVLDPPTGGAALPPIDTLDAGAGLPQSTPSMR